MDQWSIKMMGQNMDALRASVVGFLRHGQEGLNNDHRREKERQ